MVNVSNKSIEIYLKYCFMHFLIIQPLITLDDYETKQIDNLGFGGNLYGVLL